MPNIETVKVVAELSQVWQAARLDPRPVTDVDAVLDRLERKYREIAEAADSKT